MSYLIKRFSAIDEIKRIQSEKNNITSQVDGGGSEQLSSQQEALGDDIKVIKKAIRKDRKGVYRREYDALLAAKKKEQFKINHLKRVHDRDVAQAQELHSLAKAREYEDAAGIAPKDRVRRFEDFKISTKHKLQDAADAYYGKTGGRSLGGDVALGTAGLAGGYIAYKYLKKAKYERDKAKKQAEDRFKK